MESTLFPHTYIPESRIKQILQYFSPLNLFQPWYMEPPAFLAAGEYENIHIMNPPDALRPGEEFMSLL